MLRYERQAWQSGCTRVAGVDEVGRGPLAGPVVAAAVVIDRHFAEREEHGLLDGLVDSKQLSERRREAFFAVLADSPHVRTGIGIAEPPEIDTLNIAGATHEAMLRAVCALRPCPDHILLDGLPVAGFACPVTAIVKGDAKSISIAAASVVGKVTRDRMMRELDKRYPGYGLARHKGYGTTEHVRALHRLGPSPTHRRSFRPVRERAGGFPRQIELFQTESTPE